LPCDPREGGERLGLWIPGSGVPKSASRLGNAGPGMTAERSSGTQIVVRRGLQYFAATGPAQPQPWILTVRRARTMSPLAPKHLRSAHSKAITRVCRRRLRSGYSGKNPDDVNPAPPWVLFSSQRNAEALPRYFHTARCRICPIRRWNPIGALHSEALRQPIKRRSAPALAGQPR
jgi:hypothetical protein